MADYFRTHRTLCVSVSDRGAVCIRICTICRHGGYLEVLDAASNLLGGGSNFFASSLNSSNWGRATATAQASHSDSSNSSAQVGRVASYRTLHFSTITCETAATPSPAAVRFTCAADGTTFVGSKVCDGTQHCSDGSDEMGCAFRCQPPQCNEGCAFDQRGDGCHRTRVAVTY